MSVDRSQLARPATEVAPLLLGALVSSRREAGTVVARLTEVEAYEGTQDPASHAYRGRTPRNAVMFGEAGHLYCYFVYGMHWCANVVCGAEGTASAVLMRAAEIVEGADLVAVAGASVPSAALASGPARLARALGLDGSHTGVDLLDLASPVRLISAPKLSVASGDGGAARVRSGPRVGVAQAAEVPLRFWLDGEPSVSAYRPGGRRGPTGRSGSRADRQT